MAVIALVGRVLFATLAFVSAWLHLDNPDNFVDFYSESYSMAYGLIANRGIDFPTPE